VLNIRPRLQLTALVVVAAPAAASVFVRECRHGGRAAERGDAGDAGVGEGLAWDERRGHGPRAGPQLRRPPRELVQLHAERVPRGARRVGLRRRERVRRPVQHHGHRAARPDELRPRNLRLDALDRHARRLLERHLHAPADRAGSLERRPGDPDRAAPARTCSSSSASPTPSPTTSSRATRSSTG
jgi:hypothetical protein